MKFTKTTALLTMTKTYFLVITILSMFMTGCLSETKGKYSDSTAEELRAMLSKLPEGGELYVFSKYGEEESISYKASKANSGASQYVSGYYQKDEVIVIIYLKTFPNIPKMEESLNAMVENNEFYKKVETKTDKRVYFRNEISGEIIDCREGLCISVNQSYKATPLDVVATYKEFTEKNSL